MDIYRLYKKLLVKGLKVSLMFKGDMVYIVHENKMIVKQEIK